MTYNFDPDGWYERHRRLLDHRLAEGEIDNRQYRQELQDLDHRYDEMVRRLDGTYALPKRQTGHNP